MRRICLDGEWSLQALRVEENNYDIKDGSCFPIDMPGCVQDALIEGLVVPDPYYARNELETLFIGRSDWRISRSFNLQKTSGKTYILRLEKVDTIASLSINGSVVASFDNEHRIYEIDVTGFLKDGDNTIQFDFTSSEKVALQRQSQLDHPIPCSRYMYDSPARNLVRKAQCNAAWDWGLCMQTIGIHESILLFECERFHLSSFSAIPKRKGCDWELQIKAFVKVFHDCEVSLRLRCAGRKIEKVVKLKETDSCFDFDMEIPSFAVELWWPNGLGEQVLYDVLFELGDYELSRKIGFRTIEVRNEMTMGGKELTVVVNGQPVFCKGANWIPLDARPCRMTAERFDSIIRDVRDSNMNMLRVWGGGWYEKEAFYDSCDRYGILLWHDLMFSCSTYPAEDWFLESVDKELRDQVRRLSSRTCIALWCGNNECLGALGWYEETRANLPLYLKDYEKLYSNWIDHILVEEDPSRMYWPSSPCAGPGDYSDNWHSDGNGDMHYWTVWHERKDFEFYHSVKPRFCSEFGYQSFPSLSEVKSFAPEDELSITSPVMEHHQRNDEGNSIINEMFTRYFRPPVGFENQLYLSQVQQAYAIKTAVTYWRSLMPYCMGTLFWQLNDVWPVSSWSSIEYSGKWKPLQYAAKRFYKDVAPLIYTDGGKVFVKVCNDGRNTFEGKCSIAFMGFDGSLVKQLESDVKVNSLEVVTVLEEDLGGFDTSSCYICVSFGDIEETLLLSRPKDAEILDPELRYSVSEDGGCFSVKIRTENPAFYVVPDAGSIKGRFDDCLFTLNGERTVKFTPENKVSLEEFKASLKVYDLFSTLSER